MELNLAAMLPVSGGEPGLGAVRAEGSFVLPDRLRFTMRLGEADSEVVATMIAVGSDVYVKDPLGSGWYKDSGGETDVSLVEQLRTLNQPTVAPTELVGLVDLEDGSRGYVLVAVAANDLEGFGGFGGEGTQTFMVGVEDFLTKQFTVEIAHDGIQQGNDGVQGENDSLVTVKFYDYDVPVDVSPPKDFTAFPPPQTGSPVPLVPHIAGILPDTSTAGTVPRVVSITTAAAIAGGAPAAGKFVQLTFGSPIKVEGNPGGLQVLITRANGQQFLIALKGCGTSGKIEAVECSPEAGITTLVFGEITAAAGSTQCKDTAAGCSVQRFQFNGVPVRSIAGNANIDPTIPAHTVLVGGDRTTVGPTTPLNATGLWKTGTGDVDSEGRSVDLRFDPWVYE